MLPPRSYFITVPVRSTQSNPTQQLGLDFTVCAILTNCITNQASSQITCLHAVFNTNMMSNSNKFSVPDDNQMNTAQNNSVADLRITLSYSSMQIQWSLDNQDPRAVRTILCHLSPTETVVVHYYILLLLLHTV